MQLAASLSVALRLGRISNLPTVWTNTLVGVTLAGGAAFDARLPLLLVATSLFYVGGMFLNDAFDRGFDASARPDRPIPAGQVTATTVFGAGFSMLGAGILILALVGYGFLGGTGWRAPIAGVVLAACIVLYDAYHKHNPLSPVIMGACRALVYVTAGLGIAAALGGDLLLAALIMWSYLIGLTYTAKREHLKELGSLWPVAALAAPVVCGGILAWHLPWVLPFWLGFTAAALYALRLLYRRARGDVPRAIAVLIAGISLLDALILSAVDAVALAWLAVGAFALTLASQKFVSGT